MARKTRRLGRKTSGSIQVRRDGLWASVVTKKGIHVLEISWSGLKSFVAKHGKLKYPTRKTSKKERQHNRALIKESRGLFARFRRWEKTQKRKRAQ